MVAPFLDFYNDQNIIPVSQKLDNLAPLIRRRGFLYQKLGINLRALRGCDILEFGPGGGYNAIVTAQYKPRKYHFVDGSKLSIERLHAILKKHIEVDESHIYNTDLHEFRSTEKFDLVLCEGLLNGQHKPDDTLRHVANFVAPGGMIVITTSHLVAMLPELLRRLLRIFVYRSCLTTEERLGKLCDIFLPHLETFGTETRPIKDWVYDSIIHNWQDGNYSFNLSDAIEVLNEDFEFVHAFPDFSTDGRWYKGVGDQKDSNQLATLQFSNSLLSFLDFRVPFEVTYRATLETSEINLLCSKLAAIHDFMLVNNSVAEFSDVINILIEIRDRLPTNLQITCDSINDYIAGVGALIAEGRRVNFGSFSSWWGRAQMYSSFVRRDRLRE